MKKAFKIKLRLYIIWITFDLICREETPDSTEIINKIAMQHIKLLLLLIWIFTSSFLGRAENKCPEFATISSILSEQNDTASKLIYLQSVYVCTGSYAYAFHSRSNCSGLGNCKGEIINTDEDFAINKLGRVPCCRCWPNVSERCKDDNPNMSNSAGVGGDSEPYKYFALVTIIASAAILSNDIYLYPAYSMFKRNIIYDSSSGISGVTNGTGWVLGFRKTFKHSAFEYGVSVFKSNVDYVLRRGYHYSKSVDRWGGHLNYVHQVFYNRTPDWIKLYLGPSINFVYSFGYGGIVGSEMRLFDRLKFDVRYEWTTQTNQIQAGLIFNYQKRYLWQK